VGNAAQTKFNAYIPIGTRRVGSLSTYSASSLPLIVWVDDSPANNIDEVQLAQSLGVNVIQLSSTALAKDWVEENEGLHDPLRMINDLMHFHYKRSFARERHCQSYSFHIR
jgi:hypothetical protein